MNLARVRWAVIYLAMVAWAILWSFPWKFHKPAGLPTDLSFTPLAHTFFAQGRPWGTGTLHTTGIWGFLRFPLFDPETFPIFVSVNIALGALIGWFFADRGRHLPQRPWMFLLASAVLLPLLSVSDDARWYMPIFGLLVVRNEDQSPGAPSAMTWALALGAALAIHTKGNLFIATVVVAVALLASDIYQRRIPWTVILVGAFTVILLYAGGGDLAGFVRYAIHVIESTRAYPEAFSQSHDAVAPALFLLGVICAGLARCLQIQYRWQWPLAIAFGVLLFLLYKGAFVRHDAIHVTRSLTAVLLVVGTELVAAICCWPLSGIPRWRATTAAGLAVASLGLFLSPLTNIYVREILTRDVWEHPGTAARFVRTPLKIREWYREQDFARIRHVAPLKGIDGTVATAGTYLTPVLAHGLRSETIPVIAHYEVWSPRSVADMDQYLASDEAPRFLVRTANYSSVSNELSVARLYRPIYTVWYYTILERRAEPLVVSSETLFDGTVGWDEPIDIPSEHWDSVLVADVRFHKNMAGRLVSFLHHPPHAEMVLEKSDGSEASIRINSLISGQGVVAAALVAALNYGDHMQRRRFRGGDIPKTIQDGHWGGSGEALHLARHPILTEAESNVRRIRFRAGTPDRDASGLFESDLQVRIRVVSFGDASHEVGERKPE